MIKKVFCAGVVCCFLALGFAAPAFAQLPGTALRATIPFDFTVRGKTLPAGEYEVRRLSDAPEGLIIQNEHNHTRAVFETESVQARNVQRHGEIVFHRYGDSYFLYEVWAPGELSGRELPRSRAERNKMQELASDTSLPHETVVIALY